MMILNEEHFYGKQLSYYNKLLEEEMWQLKNCQRQGSIDLEDYYVARVTLLNFLIMEVISKLEELKNDR